MDIFLITEPGDTQFSGHMYQGAPIQKNISIIGFDYLESSGLESLKEYIEFVPCLLVVDQTGGQVDVFEGKNIILYPNFFNLQETKNQKMEIILRRGNKYQKLQKTNVGLDFSIELIDGDIVKGRFVPNRTQSEPLTPATEKSIAENLKKLKMGRKTVGKD